MADPRFFTRQGPFRLGDLLEWADVTLSDPQADLTQMIDDVAPLNTAGPQHLSFFDNPKYKQQFTASAAGFCLVKPKFVQDAPEGMLCLLCDDPYRNYARIAQQFYPRRQMQAEISPQAYVDPTASIGEDAVIEPGAYIGAQAVIGERAYIAANTVIASGVTIGAESQIGPVCTISHADVGMRCIIHRGVQIGQDGFGFAMGRDGHIKVPQLGRVQIGHEVEIGANSCIDRGTGPDTRIGDGTKIDNLVQIGHNVEIGRGCVIVAQCGISGSTKIGDGVVLGGQAGVAGHLSIGSGAQIAAKSGVMHNLDGGKAYGGYPAVPIKDWHRQSIALQGLIKKTATNNEAS
jgi:UDP-3-O-[3-hydroxymyristoyl] glucosamine N-acyltransferase